MTKTVKDASSNSELGDASVSTPMGDERPHPHHTLPVAPFRECGIPARTLPPCDLPWGHDGDMHANAGDGFYARDYDAEHHERQRASRPVAPPLKDAWAHVEVIRELVKFNGAEGRLDVARWWMMVPREHRVFVASLIQVISQDYLGMPATKRLLEKFVHHLSGEITSYLERERNG